MPPVWCCYNARAIRVHVRPHTCSPSRSSDISYPHCSPDSGCASFSSGISPSIPVIPPTTKSLLATGCTTAFTASTQTGSFFPLMRARPAGNAPASCRRPDSVWAPLWSSCELERTHGRNVMDDRWSVAAASALGRSQCGQSWTRAVPRPPLRGNVRRRPADRLLRLDENLDVSFSRRLSIHLETALAANRLEESAFLRGGLCRRIFTRRFPAGSLQPHPWDDPHIRSRVCRIGTRTRKASSDSYLCIDSHRTRRGDVVYSTDYPATLFRPTLASPGKSSQQSHRLRGHARLGNAQCLLYCTGSCSRVVLAPESWSFVDRGLHRPAHRIPYSTADL